MYPERQPRAPLAASRKFFDTRARRANPSQHVRHSLLLVLLLFVLFLFVLGASCSPPDETPTGADDAGVTPDGGGEDASCDPLENPCRALERLPVATCAVRGTAPGGLPQLDITAAPTGGDVVAASRTASGAVLYAHADGRIVDGDGELLHTARGTIQGIAADPVVAGRLAYTTLENGALTVVIADAATQADLLRLSYDTESTGGAVAFDEEGRLLIALGDDDRVDEGAAQDAHELRGSLLRVELGAIGEPYAIPADNPYVDGTRGAPEVFAYGLHDPQSLEAFGARIWLTDRGASRDEVHVVEADRNLGWPSMDGRQCAPGAVCTPGTFSAPVADYVRTQGSCGIAGGAQYPSDGPIDELRDAFVYIDRCDGLLRALRIGDDGRIQADVIGFDDADDVVAVPTATLLVRTESLATLSLGDGASMAAFPTRLSETGCFDLRPDGFEPTDGVIPFFVRSPLWTDGADKRRFFVIPNGQTATVDEWGHLVFPPGSLIFKSFGFDLVGGRRPVEMRVMRRNARTWSYYSYRFDENGDATVLSGKFEEQFQVVDGGETVTVDYLYPDQGSCRACHSGSREVLGPRLDQLAGLREYARGDHRDQLAELVALGLVEPATAEPMPVPTDTSQPVAARARAYLDANCSHCHRPGGWVPPDLTLDLRYSTPLEETNTCGVRLQYDSPFVPGDYRIKPGAPEESVLFERMMTRGFGQMPLFATSRVDPLARELIATWITQMECEPPR